MGKIIQVKAGISNVTLPPNGLSFNAGQSTTVTDAEYAGLNAAILNSITVTNGSVADPVRGNSTNPTSLSDAVAQANAYTTSQLVNYLTPSGDTTGVSDLAAINAKLTSTGSCLLQPGKVYYVNGQVVLPDTGALATASDGAPAILRQAAGTNLAVPLVASNNFVHGGSSPSAGSLPLSIRNLVIDVNAQNQGYGGQAWLTAGPNYLNGPDGLTINNTDAVILDVEVRNPVRHGIVTCDASAGTNSVGSYTGVGTVTPSNVYGIKLRYTVTGWGLFTGNYHNNCTGTMTAGSSSVTGSTGTYQAGMTVFGPGIMPGTVVTSVSGSTVNLSQPVVSGSNGNFYTAWGQRGRWNTAVSNGCTDGWELPGCQVRQMNADWLVKFDGSGGWRVANGQHWGGAYGGCSFLFAQNATIIGNQIGGSLGASPVGVATVNGAISSGAFVAPLAVNAIPIALPQFTPLMIRTASGPLFLMTNSAAVAGATSLSVYGANAPAAISSGAIVYLPMVGKLVGCAAGGPAADQSNIVYTNENTATDYLYQCWISADTSARSRKLSVPGNYAQNNSGATGASSVGFGFVGPGTNTATFRGTNTCITEGQTAITTPFLKCGGATITLTDGNPT